MLKFVQSVLFTLVLASPALAGDAVIFNGNFVKALKDDLLLYDTARIITGTADPSSVATLGEKGSLYLRQTAAGDGEAYIKRDNGSTTNWDLIQTSASTVLTPSRAVVTDGDGYLAASATTATEIGYLSGVTAPTGTGALVLATGPTIDLTNATGLPLTTGVTGTLPVANGGTGVTSSTGTGSVVLSTSPTLVTPDLGTPSAVNLTNATNVPAASVTGTLPVANGGTGVTSSTGTGSVVLSDSPTLVTPALGTPSAAVLTNATGLPLTTGVTGVLDPANGGTGVANNAAATLTRSGNHALTLTTTGVTSVTLPTSGTLATDAIATATTAGLVTSYEPTIASSVATTGNADYSIASGVTTVIANNSSDHSVTIPAASSNAGRRIYIKKTGASGVRVTLTSGGSDTLDGYTLSGNGYYLTTQYAWVTIESDGTAWYVIDTGGDIITDSQTNFTLQQAPTYGLASSPGTLSVGVWDLAGSLYISNGATQVGARGVWSLTSGSGTAIGSVGNSETANTGSADSNTQGMVYVRFIYTQTSAVPLYFNAASFAATNPGCNASSVAVRIR